MKIGIDARMYGPIVGGGGLGRYVQQIITHLQEIDQHNRYVLFLKRENFEACHLTNPHFEKSLADIHWYTWKEQIFLSQKMDAKHLDLIHFPHWNVPLNLKTPFVVTIHDLILLEEPSSAHATTKHPLVYAFKYRMYRHVLAHALLASSHIITVSHYTKQSILKFFPQIAADKITVVHEGLTSLPAPADTTLPLPTTPFLLYAGNAYPHKNLDTLIEAFALLRKQRPDVSLVLAGRDDIFSQRLQETVQRIPHLAQAVQFFKNPTDEQLAQLYKQAAVFVFPSRTEGFGLPPLEAMSAGIPVATSRAGSLPEILGDAAVYFDPQDPADMARVIGTLLKDKKQSEALVELGRKRAQIYSWNTTAKDILHVYGKNAS